MTSEPPLPLERYKIRSQIGEGGMGKVYLAFDQELSRDVAVKVISERFAHNEQYWDRFKKEARAISALNHPNILTIHDVGRLADTLYLVTEYVQGCTLRHHMSTKAISVVETIDIAIQIADALAAAHAARLIHRDIKPENIMVREDGYIKVLDFGLAKLVGELQQTHSDSVDPAPDLSTIPIQSDSQSIVGTIGYMSPEQLRGSKLDPRTDIWSLGVIVYEMLAGRPPFDRPTKSDKIAAILEHEPTPLLIVKQQLPVELVHIVENALAKDRDLRYESAAELRDDLKKLKKTLDWKQNPGSDPSEQITIRTDPESKVSTVIIAAPTKPDHFAKPASNRLPIAFLFAMLGLLSTLGIIYFYRQSANQNAQIKPPVQGDMVNLTNTGKSILGAISPDGKYVAHVSEEGDGQSLVIRSVTTGTSAVGVPSEKVSYRGLTFSKDSDYVYFVRYENSDVGRLYKIAVIGANTRKILDKVDSPITFSPDGTKFAFVRIDRDRAEYSMIVANAEGTNEQTIARRGSGEQLSLSGPSWSPDSKRIVGATASWTGGYHTNLFEVNLLDGKERQVPSAPWFTVLQIAWLNDQNLLVNGSTQPLAPLQIWRLSYPDGKLDRVTNDLSDYIGLSVSQDGKTIVTAQNNRQASIWIGDAGADQENRVVTTVGSTYGLAWGAGNKIFFSSMSGTHLDISVINTDGSDRRQLTFNAGDNYHPAVSPDGRYVVFSSSRTGVFNIWRMDATDGSNQKPLTSGEGDFNPYVSPDNRFVVYERQSGGSSTVWKVSIEGGDAAQIVDKYCATPAVSADGQFIACRYYIAPNIKGVAIIPFTGGEPIKQLAIPIINWQRVRWSRDGTSLTYVESRGDDFNLWSQPIRGGPGKQLTNFKGEQIFSYDWSADFRQLVSQRGTEISDVFAIRLPS